MYFLTIFYVRTMTLYNCVLKGFSLCLRIFIHMLKIKGIKIQNIIEIEREKISNYIINIVGMTNN